MSGDSGTCPLCDWAGSGEGVSHPRYMRLSLRSAGCVQEGAGRTIHAESQQ